MSILREIFIGASAIVGVAAVVLAVRKHWFLATWCAAGAAFSLYLAFTVIP